MATRKENLKSKYGITLEAYDLFFEAQQGRCAICGNKQRNKRLAVDHDHQTGKVRGLLCVSCNMGLGCFKDHIDYLSKAITYLDVNRNAE